MLHVVAGLICIFLVPLPVDLIPKIPKFLHPLGGEENGVTGCSFEKISSLVMSIFFSNDPNFASV
jgi:hypothetical protein